MVPMLFAFAAAAALDTTSEHRLTTFSYKSRYFNEPRTIRVYVPPTYHSFPNRRYPVLYLHDGQNVFSFAGTNIAFGWGSWELDKTADSLSRSGKMQEAILVGIDNAGMQRYAEYCGAHHPDGTATNTAYENYSAFLIEELKPRIDKEYRTRSGASDTAVMGSSMGGICSLILAWEHPDTFGGAASISGAYMVEKTNFLNHVLRAYKGKSKPFKIYMDSGNVDFTGGDDGRSLTDAVSEELRRIGWGWRLLQFVDAKPLTDDELAESGLRKDKWKEARISQHNEFYWRHRAWRPLTFLFPGVPSADSLK